MENSAITEKESPVDAVRRSLSMPLALDSLLEGCMLLGFDWTYLYCNKAAARQALQEPENLIGRTMISMYPGVENSTVFQRYRIAMEQRIPQHFESDYTFSDGTQRWFEFNVEPVPQGIFIFSLDITKRKQTQEALEEALDFSKSLIDTMHDGFSILDANGTSVDVNPALCKMTGFSRDELVGLNAPFPYWPPEEYGSIQSVFEKSLSGTVDGRFELIFMHKNGERFPVTVSPAVIRDTSGHVISYVATIRDISDRIKAIEALKRSEAWFRSIFENTNTCIASTDSEGNVTSFNEGFRALLGYDAETLKTKNFAEFTHPDDLNLEGVYFQEILENKRNGYHMTKRYINRDGRDVWVDLSAAVIRNANGEVANFVAVIQDITERKAAEQEIEQLAFYDLLTQLPNRRLLQDRLKQALAAVTRKEESGALLFIDLDNFKSLNDTLGHDMGDMLLQQVARRLESCIRETDTVARLGGDEFVVMLTGLSEHALKAAEQTEVISEKILAALSQPFQLSSYEYRTTTSVGATLFNAEHGSIEELMKQADIAMYQAKQAGRNTLRFFDQQMQKSIAARVELESDLHKAIEKQQFQLYFQIQVDEFNHPVGAEALIRWPHPERGIVSPAQFIPLAEETGMILPIGQWVLERACEQIKAWQANERTRHLVLAVNVSVKQFRQVGFAAQLEAMVTRYGINPQLLKLELTEGMLLENVEETIATMSALNKIGLRFSLDDFGTGYSSLQYLKKLPLDQLKIDQSFVRDIASDSSDKAIVRTIIAMARSLNLNVIAEGVETEEQRQLLLDSGCQHYQGYLFSKPVPIKDFETLLRQV
ncbi:MAG TPA: EAL domain-containing protein [Pseudomonadales bacterium]|nr:EAL domain-containing protein [Pseudomonadales bacterium]